MIDYKGMASAFYKAGYGVYRVGHFDVDHDEFSDILENLFKEFYEDHPKREKGISN